MGGGQSTGIKKKAPSGRNYRPPDVRQKSRYEPEETNIYSSQNDASIDKVRPSDRYI